MSQVLKVIDKTYSANDVARCFVKIAREQGDLGQDPETNEKIKGEGITNLKLQKMLYFADAVSLAYSDKPLIEEDFEAWKMGPVIRSIYREYRGRGSTPIEIEGEITCDEKLETFLKEVWKIFGKFSAVELVNLTHKSGSPWEKFYDESDPTKTIPKDAIKQYYKAQFCG